MARINLNLRNASSTVETPINIVVRWNGQTLVYPSGERITPRHWSGPTQTVKRSLTGHPEFNERLEAIKGKVATAYRQFVNENDQRQPSLGELRDRLSIALGHKAAEGPRTLFAFIQDYITKAKTRVNKKTNTRLSPNTLKKYVSTLNHLQAFAKAKRMRVDFDTVDLLFYDRFITYLTIDQVLATNSVGKYISTLKAFLRSASEEGHEVNSAFRSRKFHSPSEETESVYLTAQELNDLYHLDLTGHPRLDRARDLFIVGAWTGLRHSDWSQIRPEQIVGDMIRIRSQKTKKTVVIPVNPVVRAIIVKYDNALPRGISNQKMNDYLKEIAGMLPSLNEPFTVSRTVGGCLTYRTKAKSNHVTTHTARRSFATNAYKGDGYNQPIPSLIIMAITGHKTERDFLRYIAITEEEYATEFERYMDKAAPLALVN